MPTFGKSSAERLATCDHRLRTLFERVVTDFDCSIITGHRGKVEQNAAFNAGNSQIQWPNGKHNALPSKAVDAQCYPIEWGDRERQTYFAGQVMATARMMGIPLRWGGDWDGDTEVKDNAFDDLCHFEIADGS